MLISTDGQYQVCCLHHTPDAHQMNIRTHAWQDWYHGPHLQEVRTQLLSDQRHPGCDSCWRREDQGLSSLRLRTQHEYERLGVDPYQPKIKVLEVQPSNLCNLRCVMCNERYSSGLLAENKRLQINLLDQRDLRWQDKAYDNFNDILDQDIELLTVLGGEPFYNQSLMHSLAQISQSRASQCDLRIITNATVFDDAWTPILNKFRHIQVMLSIDAVDDLYEYIRYPAQWTVTQQKVDSMMSGLDADFMVNCAVQNLNILHLAALINWCQEKNLYLQLNNVIDPDYLHVANLPEHLRQDAIGTLAQLVDLVPDRHVVDALKSFQHVLELSRPDHDLWNKFCLYQSRRDHLRGTAWQQFLPAVPD